MSGEQNEDGKSQSSEEAGRAVERDYDHEDVPEIIGSGQDSTQMANTIRRGYAAFVRGEMPSHNPYKRRFGENFSGFKKRKKMLWDGGWKLAAVREGDYTSIQAVEDDQDGLHTWTPQAPTAGLYPLGASDPTPAGGLTTKYVYKPAGHEFFETRHECIGYAARNRSTMPRFGQDPEGARQERIRKLTHATAYERVRPPLIEPHHQQEGDDGA